MYKHLIFPFFHRFDPEDTHSLILHLLSSLQKRSYLEKVFKKFFIVNDPRLKVNVFGLKFDNPIGIAAGFDKNGVATRALSWFGFSHVEAGTVTPVSQPGKPRPRIFRLRKDLALINRMGFPSGGAALFKRYAFRERKRNYILGVNMGANATTTVAGKGHIDYATCLKELHKYGDYFTINISSPNTQGLRLLQAKESLDELLKLIFKTAAKLKMTKPILVKIAPDLSDKELKELVGVIKSYPVAGIIATNTTIDRQKQLKSADKKEAGGLSGIPVKKKSTEIIRSIYKITKGKLPIIGVGGIFTAADAIEKLKAGASLVQVYTGFVYEGPLMAKRINQGILDYMEKHKIKSLNELHDKLS